MTYIRVLIIIRKNSQELCVCVDIPMDFNFYVTLFLYFFRNELTYDMTNIYYYGTIMKSFTVYSTNFLLLLFLFSYHTKSMRVEKEIYNFNLSAGHNTHTSTASSGLSKQTLFCIIRFMNKI